MTDRELIELIAAQVGSLTKDMSDLKKGQEELVSSQSKLTVGQENLESEVSSIKKIVLNIEEDHGKKLDALFDGYKQNTDRLDRIEVKIDAIDEKVQTQEVEIRVLKNVK